VTLVESREWAQFDGRTDGARLHATGAVLFATLELTRPNLVSMVGTWPGAQDPPGHRGRRARVGSGAARCASWLLGR